MLDMTCKLCVISHTHPPTPPLPPPPTPNLAPIGVWVGFEKAILRIFFWATLFFFFFFNFVFLFFSKKISTSFFFFFFGSYVATSFKSKLLLFFFFKLLWNSLVFFLMFGRCHGIIVAFFCHRHLSSKLQQSCR